VTMLVKAFIAATASLVLGLWLTQRLLTDGGPFDAIQAGPWSLSARAGATDADPYTRASLARSGEIPIGIGEGLKLVAKKDDSGRALESHCVYRVGPHAPIARYWTLELTDVDGFPVDNPADRYVFRSSEILREPDGGFAVWVSPATHAGNWLPNGGARLFALTLRLYDTAISGIAGGVDRTAMPAITRESCS